MTVPVRVEPVPDAPLIYLPDGGFVTTTEDSDIVLRGVFITERDGVYLAGEMRGGASPLNLDTDPAYATTPPLSTAMRRWTGKVLG